MYDPINLLQNLDTRAYGDNFAIYNVAEDRISQNSCFITDYQTIKQTNNNFIIGIDFSESLFIHAIMHAQHLISGFLPFDVKLDKLHKLLQNYEIYIGDSPDY